MALTNIKPLDPVQGFVDYILDIKPYHSKILEVLIEYIYTDPVNVTINEKLEWKVDAVYSLTDPIISCSVGFDNIPYGSISGETVLNIDPVTDSFVVPGDRTKDFPIGSNITVRSQIIDGINDTIIDPVGLHTGTYTIVSTTYTPGNALVDPSTTIFVTQDIIDPIPPTAAPNVYVVTLSHSPIPIIGIIPPSSAENPSTNVGSNMFVVAGDHTSRFIQGLVFKLDGGNNTGNYTVLYSDLVSGDTRIRVLEEIPDVLDVAGQIKPLTVGFDYTPPICSNIPSTLLHVNIKDDLHITTDLGIQEQVIAYNFENSDGIGFGHDPFGNVLPLTSGGQYGSDNYTIYHPQSQVSIDTTNNAFILKGGHYSERFEPSLLISGYNITGPSPGHLGDWTIATYNILNVDDVSSTVTVGGDLTWLFAPNRIFDIHLSITNYQTFTVVNSTYDALTNTTTIQTAFPPVLTPTAEVGVPHANDLGIIYGAIYEPAEFNPQGESTTIIATQTPLNPAIESIGYTRYSPLRINVGFNPLDSISNTILDNMSLSNTMLTTPAIFDIFSTNAVNDTFSIRYVDHNTGIPLNVSKSFPIGSVFRVVGSNNGSNDQEWTVQDVTFNGTDTIITVVGNITNDSTPYGEIIRETSTVGAPAENLARTSFLETLSLGWVIDSWFSYIILGVNQSTQEFTIAGNALIDVQAGMDIRIVSSPTNNGTYSVQSVTFNGTNTIVKVNSPIPGPEYGGFLTPDEGLGMVLDMKLSFTDTIGVTVTENAEAVVLTEGGSLVGAFDYTFWDVGSYDESLGTTIYLYNNT